MIYLLATPALSMPFGHGNSYGAGCCLVDLSDEELMNMTLGEINTMKEAKIEERNNMTLAEIRETLGLDDNVTLGRQFMGSGACLLLTDLTLEDLESMTISEIETLKEERLAEIDNMTLAELKEQKEVCSIVGNCWNYVRQDKYGGAGLGGAGMGPEMKGSRNCQSGIGPGMGHGYANDKGMSEQWGWGGNQFGMKGFGNNGYGFGR